MSFRPPVFAVDEDCGTSLADLATDLFYEAVDFARMAATIRDSGKGLDLYLPRMEMIRLALGALTDACGLRFSARIPFVYNTATWECPCPSGFTDGPGHQCPRPDELVRSLMSSCMSLRYREPAGTRIEKAVVFVAATEGYGAALEYLFELIDFGFVSIDGSGPAALIDLLGFQAWFKQSARGTQDEACRKWAARALPDLEQARSAQDWLRARLELPRSATASLAELHDERIFGRLFDLIALARGALNLTEFLVNLARLNRAVSVFFSTRRELDPEKAARIPVALRSVYSQLEEIRADGGVFLHAVTGRDSPPTGETVFGVSAGFAGRPHRPGETRERILAQRVLTPSVLGELPAGGYTDLPNRWARLDHRVVIPLGALAGTDLRALCLKGPRTPLGAPVRQSAYEYHIGLFRALGSAMGSYERIESCEAASFAFPWSPVFQWEYAIALDEGEGPARALAPITTAVFQDPGKKEIWQSYGVIAHRLGHPELAHRLRAVGMYLAQFHPTLVDRSAEGESTGGESENEPSDE